MALINRAANVYGGGVQAKHVYRGDTHVWPPPIEVPVGAVFAYPTTTPPASWLLCDGGDCSKYPELVAVLGSSKTPDYRDKFVFGDTTPGKTGGVDEITEAQTPLHSHNGAIGGNGSDRPSHRHQVDSNYNQTHKHITQFKAVTYKDGNQFVANRWVVSTAAPEVIQTAGGHTHDSGAGDTGAHGHDIGVAGDQDTSWLPPHYTLVYIIKAAS